MDQAGGTGGQEFDLSAEPAALSAQELAQAAAGGMHLQSTRRPRGGVVVSLPTATDLQEEEADGLQVSDDSDWSSDSDTGE